MKNYVFIAVLLLCTGCGMPTQQDYQNWTETLDAVIPAVREVAGNNPKLDKIIGDVEIVRESVAEAKTLPEAVGKGIEASKPFNPYAEEMGAILAIGVAIAGVFAKKKSNEAKAINEKYQAHKAGTELVKLTHPEIAAELYKNIGDARKAKGIA